MAWKPRLAHQLHWSSTHKRGAEEAVVLRLRQQYRGSRKNQVPGTTIRIPRRHRLGLRVSKRHRLCYRDVLKRTIEKFKSTNTKDIHVYIKDRRHNLKNRMRTA